MFCPLFVPFLQGSGWAESRNVSTKAPDFRTFINEYGLPYFEIKPQQKNARRTIITMATVGDIRITKDQTFENANNSILVNDKSKIVTWLRSQDILIGNLEMTFLDQPSLCSPSAQTGKTEWAKLLSALGFSALNLANNHFQFDGGTCGITTSLNLLRSTNIEPVGIGDNFIVLTRNNIKIGMLGYGRYTMNSEVPHQYKIGDFVADNMLDDVIKYKPLVDHLVVSIHWGEVRFEVPNPEEEELAIKLLGAGASVICGSGPHVLQKIAIYENGVIAHSLGNFIFDKIRKPNWNAMSTKSCVLEVDFSKHTIEGIRVYPMIINSGLINIPDTRTLDDFKRHLEGLYTLTESDFHESYGLWKRISDRLKLAWQDARQDPRQAFERHLKPRFFVRAISFFYQKYKAFLVIGSFIIVCLFLFIKLRRKIVNLGQ